jgi:hypothetical protein
MDHLAIRPAQARDLGQVAEIYNAGIAERINRPRRRGR